MRYGAFIKENYRFLCFGFVLVFVGNYGQTFFISIFGGVWRETFELSHTEYSGYYSLATLISGFLLMFLGGKLDSSALRPFTLWVLAGVLVASLVLAFASHPYLLFIGFLLIRFCGQGMSTHTAFTSMSRYFDKNRGKAISIAAMGMPVGEFVMPAVGAFAIAVWGWRVTWIGLAGLLCLVFLPLLLWTLGDRRVQHPVDEVASNVSNEDSTKHWRRRDVLGDVRFWLAIPAILAPAVLITGLFFHQAYWAESRGWELSWVASSMSLYAISHAIGSLFTGALVDKWGARSVLRWYLLPLTVAILFLLSEQFWGWLVFMAISGLSVGASGPTVGSLWPEVYGTRYLGSIRSMISAFMVVSTSIAPVVLGMMIDAHLNSTEIMCVIAVYSLLGVVICQFVYRDKVK